MASNNVITHGLRDEEGCHEADQAGCGRTDHGETQQVQPQLDEITTKHDGIKKDVTDRVGAVNKEAWSQWFGKKVQSVHREPRF